MLEPEEAGLYGENRGVLIEIAGRQFMFLGNVEDGSDAHRMWMHLVHARIPVLALKPAYTPDGYANGDLTAIFVAVELQEEIQKEFDHKTRQMQDRSTA